MFEKPQIKGDNADRKALSAVLNTMEKQGAIGITQNSDYRNALVQHGLLETAPAHELQYPEVMELSKMNLIMFDLDGVIRSSDFAVYQAEFDIISRHGDKNIKAPSSHQEVAQTYASPWNEYYRRFGITQTDGLYEEWTTRRNELLKSHPEEPFAEVSGVLSKVKLLKEAGSHIALISYSDTKSADDFLKKFNLLEIFGEDIYFPDGKGKHKNEIMAELCKKYNVDNAEAVYIGDTPSDIIEARKAKIPSIAIGRDEASWSRLKNFSPNYLTETLDSILAIERNFPCIS